MYYFERFNTFKKHRMQGLQRFAFFVVETFKMYAFGQIDIKPLISTGKAGRVVNMVRAYM
jgi:hypothetical protein